MVLSKGVRLVVAGVLLRSAVAIGSHAPRQHTIAAATLNATLFTAQKRAPRLFSVRPNWFAA